MRQPAHDERVDSARASTSVFPRVDGVGPTFDRLADLDAVVGQQQGAELARPGSRLPIALGGGHDAALHEDVPLAREGVGVVAPRPPSPGRR